MGIPLIEIMSQMKTKLYQIVCMMVERISLAYQGEGGFECGMAGMCGRVEVWKS